MLWWPLVWPGRDANPGGFKLRLCDNLTNGYYSLLIRTRTHDLPHRRRTRQQLSHSDAFQLGFSQKVCFFIRLQGQIMFVRMFFFIRRQHRRSNQRYHWWIRNIQLEGRPYWDYYRINCVEYITKITDPWPAPGYWDIIRIIQAGGGGWWISTHHPSGG